jgi:hypothetical protein
MPATANPSQLVLPLQARVTCPHCWNEFPPDRALWIAQHPDLVGDPKLGADQPQRFLPTRFNVQGAALDTRGFACHGLACPKCHLGVPRQMFEMRPMFVSILGSPASGKSYFLASMAWRLRSVLPKYFSVGFNDADPVLNHRLQEYESLQFLNPNQEALVAIEKTEEQGDLYDQVLFGDQAVSYPRPFVFSLMPLDGHPNLQSAAKTARTICLYDNAGESFLPGSDTATSPVTRHLAMSKVLLFLFDPTQDMRYRKLCGGRTSDPQMMERSERLQRERAVRQETILSEAAQRVRRYTGLAHSQKHDQPLIVVVTKFDSWRHLLAGATLPSPRVSYAGSNHCAVNLEGIEDVSKLVRTLLWKISPEIVSAAESFASQVLYVPVSATGRGPETDPETGALGFRAKDMKPIWAEVPLLYTLGRWTQGLVPYVKPGAWSKGEGNKQALQPGLVSPNGDAKQKAPP